MSTEFSKKIFFILALMVFGGLGGVIANRYFFPYLSNTDLFSRYEFLKRSTEDVTVINKTEQIIVKEETSISKLTNPTSSSVVNILSLPIVSESKKTAAAKNGTGVIVTSDGMIMTYFSAMSPENSKYKVLAYDGGAYDAELIGVDSYSHLAFLKINANNLPAVSFGNSNDSKPGEKVIAIGNNFGIYSNRYAGGILSDLDFTYNLGSKNISSSDKIEGLFNVDIGDDQNFVGGPVIDYTGQVIGITGSIERDGKIAFFQIPSNKVKVVLDRAIKKELGKNAQLGAYYMPITKSLMLAGNLPVEKGALIYSASGQQGLAVIAGSPAQKAGLRLNDIVVSVGSKSIDLENSFSDLVYQHKQGDVMELTVIRDGKEMKISAQL